MERWKVLTLTEGAVAGLLAIHRYRFLTIRQFARTAGFSFDASPLATPRNRCAGSRAGALSGASGMCASPATARRPRPTIEAHRAFPSPLRHPQLGRDGCC